MHARLDGDTVEVRCHQCTKDAGRPVYHRWKIVAVMLAAVPSDDTDARPDARAA